MRLLTACIIAGVAIACGTQEWSFDADSGAGAGRDGAPPNGGCASDSDCRLSTLHCDTTSGQCVPCVDDTQCTTPGFPRCDSALHECVQCGVDGDCPPGQVCEPTSHRCVSPCSDAGRCPPTAPMCNMHGLCVGCYDNQQCAFSPTGHVCDPASGQCVQCVNDDQCNYDNKRRCCRALGECVGCLTSNDCSDNGVCDPTTHDCIVGHDD